MDCYAVVCNHNRHISAKRMKIMSNISNIFKDIKICQNELFVSETKDASEDINILAYVFYYHHQITQKAVQKNECNAEKLN